MSTFDMICLANSRKLGARCVAGLRIDGGGWLRPVGADPDGKLYHADYLLDNLTDAAPLDVIQVGVGAPRPAVHQPENWLIDGTTWKLLARPVGNNLVHLLKNALVPGPELLRGLSDRVAWEDLQKQGVAASLALVAPASIDLYHHQSYRGKPQARGRFSLGVGSQARVYDLGVSDPQWEEIIIQQGPRMLRQADAKFLLTISLGEPFGLFCYKLLATILLLPPSLSVLF